MVNNEIFRMVKDVLPKGMIELNQISEISNLKEIGFDSLDMIDLVTRIEEKYEIEISDTTIGKWQIVLDVIKTVESMTLVQ